MLPSISYSINIANIIFNIIYKMTLLAYLIASFL